MIKHISAIYGLLTPNERRRALLLLLLAIAMALVETCGVASVMPFLAVLGNPSLVETNPYLARAFELGGFADRNSFLIALGGVTLFLVVGAAAFRSFAQYAVFRYANMRRYSLSVRLFERYLGQPYEFFLGRNSAEIGARILSEVDQLVDGGIMPLVQMIAYGIVIAMLIGLMVLVDPSVAAVVTLVVGGFYAVIFLLSRKLLGRLGRERVIANQARFRTASEAFGGIKDIKLTGSEAAYLARFRVPAHAYASHKATNDTVSLVPRHLIEALALGGAIALALVLMLSRQDLGAVLPILGLYAVAGYRLLPAAQSVYNGLSRMRFNGAAVDAVVEDLKNTVAEGSGLASAPMPFHGAIRLDDVTYRYPGAARAALNGVQMEIAAGSAVGFVGATGAGKTTAVDLVLGLLAPSSGRILIDGVPLASDNRRAWQAKLGYVPQAIYLADASVAENIAFGVAGGAIDAAAVERAARMANIHEFVVSLPSGYDTRVGERGVRLSGGQRQRIGIARALYRDPPVLVFDEATSALDNATEAAVMEAVGALHGRKTIIIVAHRLSTTRGCDRIFTFVDGRVSENLEPQLLWRAQA